MKNVYLRRPRGGSRRLRRFARFLPDTWPSSPVGPSTIGDLVQRFRISRSALARMLGATVGMVWKWERREAEPSGPAKQLIYYFTVNKISVDPQEFVRKRGRKRKEERR